MQQKKAARNRTHQQGDLFWEEFESVPIDPKVLANMNRIMQDLGDSDDVVIRDLRQEKSDAIAAAVVYIDGLSDSAVINSFISNLLSRSVQDAGYEEEARRRKEAHETDLASIAEELLFGMGSIRTVSQLADLYRNLLSGEAIILIDGAAYAYRADIRHWKGRDVTESTNQTSVRGPRESFTETLRVNTSLIRRKIKDPRLWLETIAIGRMTKTDVTLIYMNGIAKPSVIEEARKRLRAIDIDSVLDSGYLEELIEDGKYSLFPTVFNSELPDNVASQLLEGKVAIVVDGTPNVLLVPTQLVSFFQSTEDYYQRSVYASLLRILRFISVFISLLLPSLYIAITTFHREMLPASLLFSLAAQREGVPFPAFVEALVMELTFEILREAGLRMPRAIGQAVSVVGTLVIGQAAVEAGIVSAAMVIVVSVTAISTFTLPAYSMSIPVRILRFAFMGVAASFGLFGVIMGLFVLLLHLCALRSFGEPFMSPFSPFRAVELEDTLVRLPRWLMFKRPGTSEGTGSTRIRRRW
ncbi:spore germination protein [Paenibacillus sp. 1011MAR3C5]|uniref:spore germination protein n=1 Tax=Paenibacillus sp. 1011MAR3C5 TaxID=1675787 RepID=UPI000E6CF1AF|nr:spore germination protein [Paenibacillus sp. 1011MAR3C5]RJE88478.1 spore germination protein [Paenibacillus sp. 1011MAR3C5]